MLPFRHLCSLAIAFAAAVPSAGSQDRKYPPRPENIGVREILVAIESGAPQPWGNALQKLARQTDVSRDEIDAIARCLKSPSAAVRRRAALALGALGPLARSAVPSLITAVSDPDSITAAEAAFALGAVHDRSETVLRVLFSSALERTGTPAGALRLAITALGRYPLVPVSAEFATQLRQALQSPRVPIRSLAIRTAMRTDVSWAVQAFADLLRDPDPGIRLDAAYALAGTGPAGLTVDTALRALAIDSVEWVRSEVPGLLQRLGSALPEQSTPSACSHRASFGAPASLVLAVRPSSRSLRGDGRGPYVGGAGSVEARLGAAFNFALPRTPRELGPVPPPAEADRDTSNRYLAVDLSAPAGGGKAQRIPTVLDPSAQFHVFFMRDARGTVWNLNDIPVGATVQSDRTELSFFVKGRYHLLQFGPWALGDCIEEYAYGARVDGRGTTPVEVHRVSEQGYRFTAPPGSKARLWAWTSREPPVDRGLYYFTFDLVLSPKQ